MKVIAIMGISICLFAVAMTNAHGTNMFTGGFVADNRPHSIYYLKLTQTRESVSGSLMRVTPNNKGSTQSTIRQLTGTTDGASITLISNQLFEKLIINGVKDGKSIVLAFPNDSGSLVNITFKPGTDTEYNSMLKQWQIELSAIQIERDSINSEHRHLRKLSETLAEEIKRYKGSTIKADIDRIKSALNDEIHYYNDLEMYFADMAHDASVQPMSCHQAHGVVVSAFNSALTYQYNRLIGYNYNEYIVETNQLEQKLSNVDIFIEQTSQVAREFEQSIKNHKHPLPNLSVLPRDEIPVINQYRQLVDSARQELNTMKTIHSDILNKARKLMVEAEALVNKTVSLVRCD